MNFIKTTISCIMITVAALAQGAALTVGNTAGNLSLNVGDKAAATTELTVTGQVDAADLQFVNHEMPELKSLDLSGASIVAYSGDRLMNGRTSTASDIIPDYAFIDSRMTSIVLPASVKGIGEGAFAASDITAINIPSGVTSIGNAAFADCSRLELVVLPAGLTELGAGAFRNCVNVTRAELGTELREIPERAFAGCSALATVFFPEKLEKIGAQAFYGVAITNLAADKSASLRSIDDWAFAGCRNLTNVYLPASTVSLGKGAFFSDDSMVSDLTAILGKADSIPAYAFTGNTSMTVTKFEKTAIKRIGDYSLRGLSEVDTVTMPATLERIGTQGMAGWTGLTSVDVRPLAENVPELGDEVWQGVAQHDVTLVMTPEQHSLFSQTPQWQDFAVKIIEPTAIDEVLAGEADASVRGYIDGDILTLESEGADIAGFQLYDLQGRMIAVPQAAPAQRVTVGVDAVGSAVVVARVLLADNTVAVLKLARR